MPHDPKPNGVFRWSEGTILNLDGEKELMMLVSAFGHGGHDDSTATILEFRSRDGGLTWTPLSEAAVFQENIGKKNVMSPSLLRLDNGDILCFFLVTNNMSDAGPWMKHSTDNGKTWDEPARLKSDYSYCFYSDDRGKTWKKTAYITSPKGSIGRDTDPAAEEPTVIELKDGRLMMFMRTYLKSIYVSYSDDRGETWSQPASSGIPGPGAMPVLRRMPDGNILLLWNWAPEEKINGPWPRNRIKAAVSTDEGKNFSYVSLIDGTEDFSGKVTMPNVTFSEDNAVITYSKSLTRENNYNWRLQVIPIKWFYQGDTSVVYGEKYLPTLTEKLRSR